MRHTSPNYIPLVSKKDTPARWICPEKGGYVLISRMTDAHLLNAISWCIRRKGHRPRKFPALVKEAIRRRLPLPEHKWVVLPEGYLIKEGWAHITTKLLPGEPVSKRITSFECLDEFGHYNPALRD